MTKIAITCPIPSTPTQAFIDSLPTEYDLLVVDDSNGKLDLPKRDNIFIYGYDKQKEILGKYYDDYTYFHKSSACRNIAHFLAYRQGYDVIIALDYDCVVPENYIEAQTAMYKMDKVPALSSETKWINPLEQTKWFTRGFPYSKRASYKNEPVQYVEGKRVVLNMGLWENVVDINGIDKVLERPSTEITLNRDYTAPLGYIPLCGMNNSFIAEITPAYFFLPNFKIGDWDVSRHDDIWGGYIFQRLAEKKGDLITYGKPVVFHERESNQANVLHYEHFMHILEPYFYDIVNEATEDIKPGSYEAMFAEFSENYQKVLEKKKGSIPEPYHKGFTFLGKFISLWTTFFQEL